MVQRRTFLSAITILMVLLLAPVAIRAEQSSAANDRLPFMADSQRDNVEAPSTSGLLLRTVGALLLIVGLIVAASWGMKRFAGARFGAPKEDAPQLAILNSLSLGDKKSLAIVRFGERTLLLGATPQSVTLLAEEAGQSPIQARSVAEILDDEASEEFAEELTAAEDRLNYMNEPAKGDWA